jgi:ABC-type nitrate/sulfonate/bicarbonate transport system substrate-binding protein
MTKINICGVPEHFNLPWHLCLENGEFAANNLDVQWTDVPEGTGKMCQMLRSGETDIAVILSEGILKDIEAGNASKIVQLYVESPLVWGIHVARDSNFYDVNNLENKKVAISRRGSGSELMAIVHADSQNWNSKNLDFEIVNTLEGAIKALSTGDADYFMWEKFMTKPIVDAGIFRRIGECPTPWPCFVIAVREEFLSDNDAAIKKFLEIINTKTKSIKLIENIGNIFTERYNLQQEDCAAWLSETVWSQRNISENELRDIQTQLFDLQIIDKKSTFAAIVSTIAQEINDRL